MSSVEVWEWFSQLELAEAKLAKAMDVLLNGLNQFVSLGLHDEDSAHDTDLDRERRHMRRRHIEVRQSSSFLDPN